MKYLTNEEKMEAREWEKLFQCPGWKLFLRELEDEFENGPQHLFWNCADWDALLAARARLRVLGEIIATEAMIDNKYANLEQAREYAALEQAESDSTRGL